MRRKKQNQRNIFLFTFLFNNDKYAVPAIWKYLSPISKSLLSMSLLTYPQLEHMLVVSTAIALGLYSVESTV